MGKKSCEYKVSHFSWHLYHYIAYTCYVNNSVIHPIRYMVSLMTSLDFPVVHLSQSWWRMWTGGLALAWRACVIWSGSFSVSFLAFVCDLFAAFAFVFFLGREWSAFSFLFSSREVWQHREHSICQTVERAWKTVTHCCYPLIVCYGKSLNTIIVSRLFNLPITTLTCHNRRYGC